MNAMTIPQLASQMGLSRVAVYRRVRRGRIPATRVGHCYIISAQTARRLLQDEITPERQQRIDEAVATVVSQYGALLAWLSRE